MENTDGDDFTVYDIYQNLVAGKRINLSDSCWYHVGEFKECPSLGTDCYLPVCAEDYIVDYSGVPEDDPWVNSCEECDATCPTPPPDNS